MCLKQSKAVATVDLCYQSNCLLQCFCSISSSQQIVVQRNQLILIIDIPAEAKKPTLYATALMSHLFSDEEMRQGSVEPKETSEGKKALDQTKLQSASELSSEKLVPRSKLD